MFGVFITMGASAVDRRPGLGWTIRRTIFGITSRSVTLSYALHALRLFSGAYADESWPTASGATRCALLRPCGQFAVN